MTGQGYNFRGEKVGQLRRRMSARIANMKLDQFADHLADGLDVKAAGERMGWDRVYANAMLQRIRKRLGPQAV